MTTVILFGTFGSQVKYALRMLNVFSRKLDRLRLKLFCCCCSVIVIIIKHIFRFCVFIFPQGWNHSREYHQKERLEVTCFCSYVCHFLLILLQNNLSTWITQPTIHIPLSQFMENVFMFYLEFLYFCALVIVNLE